MYFCGADPKNYDYGFIFMNNYKKQTLADLAAYTGLSITTVSRVLNGKSKQFRISKSSQDLVMKAAEEHGYRTNCAQNLRNSPHHTLGLLIPGIDSLFFSKLAGIVIREAQKYKYGVMVIDSAEDPREEEKAVETFRKRGIDGLIVVPTSATDSVFKEIAEEMPVVLIDRYFEDSDLPHVATDNYVGAFEATNLLIANGHRKILCLQGSPTWITSRKRVEGYRDAMIKAGLEQYINIKGNDFTPENGYIESKLALLGSDDITAILALSSTILLGSLRAIGEQGLSIPEDISLLSFDTNVFMDYINPPLTRVCQPLDHIGMAAVKLIIDAIEGQSLHPASIMFSPSIIVRSSVKNISF